MCFFFLHISQSQIISESLVTLKSETKESLSIYGSHLISTIYENVIGNTNSTHTLETVI